MGTVQVLGEHGYTLALCRLLLFIARLVPGPRPNILTQDQYQGSLRANNTLYHYIPGIHNTLPIPLQFSSFCSCAIALGNSPRGT